METNLVKECKNGNVQAFESLVKLHEKRLYHFIQEIVKNDEDARDIMQDSFFKAWKSIKKLKEETKFGPWLYKIARNMSIDYLRRRNRMQEILGQKVQKNSSTAIEFELSLQNALTSLSGTQRTALVLKKIEGLSLKEISKIMKISEGTIGWQIFSAKQKLKRIFGRK